MLIKVSHHGNSREVETYPVPIPVPAVRPSIPAPVTWRGRQFGYAELLEMAGMGNVPDALREQVKAAVAFLKISEGW